MALIEGKIILKVTVKKINFFYKERERERETSVKREQELENDLSVKKQEYANIQNRKKYFV